MGHFQVRKLLVYHVFSSSRTWKIVPGPVFFVEKYLWLARPHGLSHLSMAISGT